MAEAPKSQLLSALGLPVANGQDRDIRGITANSGAVERGFLFAALKGSNHHGASFILDAIEKGAGAILTDPEGAKIAADALDGFTGAVCQSPDPRRALAIAAARWFGGAQPECAVAVTGTNGKTSVVHFTHQIWQMLGYKSASLGTLGVQGMAEYTKGLTTPDPVALQRLLADMQSENITHLAFEASSHGLAQRRLDGVRLQAAAFTNLTQDHFDYHDGFADYLDQKMRLFEQLLPPDAPAVIALDGEYSAPVLARVKAAKRRIITISRRKKADFQILAQHRNGLGQNILFAYKGKRYQANVALTGVFQAENILTAAGLILGADDTIAPEDVFASLGALKTVMGRMQPVLTCRNGAHIFVDFSHTPGAIASVLDALRPYTAGRLWIIFGAGGNRDQSKRIEMGKYAAAKADRVIVSDDNPRWEDAAAIRKQILAGCPNALEIGDRAEAIVRGVGALEAGDLLLIAGKAGESYQEIKGVFYPFDDYENASIAARSLGMYP